MEAEVLIIGGGVAGLSCAVALADEGLKPLVIESGQHLGGRARTWTDEYTGDRVDIGPHILLSEYRNMLALLEQLGTAEDICWQEDKFITLVDKPQPVTIKMHRFALPLSPQPAFYTANFVARFGVQCSCDVAGNAAARGRHTGA